MKTTKEYRRMVEDKFGRELREIMYDLCVVQNVVPIQGADILGVPKNTFNYWRNYYWFGPNQRLADQAIKQRNDKENQFKYEIEDIDFEKEFQDKREQSLDGFEEMIERFLKLEKSHYTKITNKTLSEMSSTVRIASLETVLEYLSKYRENKLGEEYFRRLEEIKDLDKIE